MERGQLLIERIRKMIQNTPSVFTKLNDIEDIGLGDIYQFEEELNDIDLDYPHNGYVEEGEVENIMDIPTVQEDVENKTQNCRVTLEQIRNYKIDHEYMNLNMVAEAQAELEVFLDENQAIYKSLKLYDDYFNYSVHYCQDHLTIKIKQALILLCEWLLTTLQPHQVKRQIYIQEQTIPKFQYKVVVFIRYNDGKRFQQLKEIFITATPDMAYIMAEGYVIAQLRHFIGYNFTTTTLKEFILKVRELYDWETEEYKELVDLARMYFQSN